jgi:cytochrome c
MASSLVFTGSAFAASSSLSAADVAQATEVAKANGCLSCHAVDEKIVGPAYEKVAQKYKGVADASASLTQSIRNGSQGKWGRAAMPAHPNISDKDLGAVVRWVLSIQP